MTSIDVQGLEVDRLFEEAEAHNSWPACTSGTLLGHSVSARRIVLVPITCGRWDCPDCGPRKAKRIYARLMLARPERHLVLTWDTKKTVSHQATLAKMKWAFPKLIRKLRDIRADKKGEKPYPHRPLEYAALWETTAAGTPHIHVALWGSFIPQHMISREWHRLTGSYIVDIKEKTDNPLQLHNWVKYLLKQCQESTSTFTGNRFVQFSKGYHRNQRKPTSNGLPDDAYWIALHLSPWLVRNALILYYQAKPDPTADFATFRTPSAFTMRFGQSGADLYFMPGSAIPYTPGEEEDP